MQFNQAPAPRESSLGDAYDPTASYSVGEFCIHDNVLYKCTTAISGGEAWNSAHWTETNIGDEISAVNGDMTKPFVFTPNGNSSVTAVSGNVAGKSVTASMQVKVTTTTAPGWTNIGTISPAPRTQVQVGFSRGGDTEYGGLIAIETNGNIGAYSKTALTARSIVFCLAYATD